MAEAAQTQLMHSLSEIEAALADNIDRSIEIRRRVLQFQAQLTNGATIDELIHAEDEPRTVAMLTENMAILDGVGSNFRFSLAQALRDEGMTIAAVADLFGVTRQRISALLRQGAAA